MGRLIRGVGGLIAVAFMVVGLGVTNADASGTLPLECLANGTATAQPQAGGTAQWTVDGSGTCQGDVTGNYTVSLRGSGQSIGLSQCTGSPITQDFALDVAVTVTNTVSGASKTLQQTWTLPVDNYSARTLFLIGGDGTGAGYIGHNIFVACPGDGTPAASYLFSFVG